MHSNLIKNDYQQTAKFLFNFVPNKKIGQFINISPHSFTLVSTFNIEFSSIEVAKALVIENNVI